MRFIAVSDTHLGYETGRTAEARAYTYSKMFQQFELILEIAKQEKVDGIFHGGDLFNRSKPRKKVLTKAYDIINDILRNDLYFFIVPGNHERAVLPSTLLGFTNKSRFFSKLDLVELEDCNIIGFPYHTDNSKSFVDVLNSITVETTKPNIILCHQLFTGATFGPNQFQFSEKHGAINPQYISENINLIISGHIHRAQSLFDGLIAYTGSLERTSFIESIEPKGYLLVNISHEEIHIEFKQLKTIPMNVFEIDISQEKINFEELANNIRPGLHRTLVRFTGRALTVEELEGLKNHFNWKSYPLFEYRPITLNTILNPLYSLSFPFAFPTITHKIKF